MRTLIKREDLLAPDLLSEALLLASGVLIVLPVVLLLGLILLGQAGVLGK